jgi:catechol 2,3-dioxygenase-like lactoylglutathione lyase family enzyme
MPPQDLPSRTSSSSGLYQVLRTTAAVSRVAQMANALRGGESGSSTARRRLATLASHAAALARPSPQAVAAAASATSTGSSTASLGVVGAAHIARCTADVPALAAFYEKVLGFQRLVRPDFPFDGAWLRSGDFVLHIIEQPATGNRTFESPTSLDERHGAAPTKRDKPFALARGPHLALYVQDIAAAEAALQDHGIEYAKCVARLTAPVQTPGPAVHCPAFPAG